MIPEESWVLLVEDSPNDRELAMHALRKGRFAGRVEEARDGAEALDRLRCQGQFADLDRTSLPSAVLLDIKMPLVTGIEVLAEMRKDPLLATVPVVMLTSSAEDTDLVKCYALGANSYIVKPVDIEKFFQAVLEIGQYWLVLNNPPPEQRDGAGAL